MNHQEKELQKILIVDDSEMNRAILTDMLEDDYEILEAENGIEAINILQKYSTEISLVLLDIVMPEMDGFEVLQIMNESGWIEDIPVIMISAETASKHMQRAYELGVTEFIGRPFDVMVVRHRVVNTILLYTKQKRLTSLVADQVYEKEQRSNLLVNILSHIVEFRNEESGLHVLHIRTLTEILLKELVQKTDRYDLSQEDISLIGIASALHDVGKMAIPDEILNKPGRLNAEEFAVIKTHTTQGAEMLAASPWYESENLVKIAYEICRWHHERYDGKGYPDGLKGDEIPISAQIVALADVYDALTSERVYKKAIPHEKAIQMILNGECGAFNPLVLECLQDVQRLIQKELQEDSPVRANRREMQNIAQAMMGHEELSASERTLKLLEHERVKYDFFAALSQEIQFEYTMSPPMIMLNDWGAEKLGCGKVMMTPFDNEKMLSVFPRKDMRILSEEIHSTTTEQPVVQYDCQLNINGEERWTRIIVRAIWSTDEPPRYTGAIGKAIDIHETHLEMENLKRLAFHDSLTGLLNHAHARERIIERMEERPLSKYALVMFDLDHFKDANNHYGHMFGDRLLIYMAEKLRHEIRGGDIAARVGGDEFLIFLEYKEEIDAGIKRIFNALAGEYEGFPISLSMGVAKSEVVGTDYDQLLHAADKALYAVKRDGRKQYRFYDDSMQGMFSVLSPIESDEENRKEETEKETL